MSFDSLESQILLNSLVCFFINDCTRVTWLFLMKNNFDVSFMFHKIIPTQVWSSNKKIYQIRQLERILQSNFIPFSPQIRRNTLVLLYRHSSIKWSLEKKKLPPS